VSDFVSPELLAEHHVMSSRSSNRPSSTDLAAARAGHPNYAISQFAGILLAGIHL
jgi:hypothetical protein